MLFSAIFLTVLVVSFPKSSSKEKFDIDDAKLTVPELLTKYKYKNEVHQVATTNGYVLEMHRILCNNNNSFSSCQPVLLMHGMLTSSSSWVLCGPNISLGYILADAGFDVWMGNFRGNKYTKIESNNQEIDHFPIELINRNEWNYDITTLGEADTPDMISYILKTTNRNKLSYVCHSLGCTSYMIMTSETSFDERQVDKFIGLAPVFSLKHSNLLFVVIYNISKIFGVYLLPGLNAGGIFRFFSSTICSLNFSLCSFFFYLINGITDQGIVPDSLIKIIIGHYPDGMSSKILLHLAQWFNKDFIGTYQPPFGSSKPFNLNNSIVEKYIYYGGKDTSVYPKSVEFSLQQIENLQESILLEDYYHFSLIQGANVDELNRNITKILNEGFVGRK